MRVDAGRAGLWVRQVLLAPPLRASRPLLFVLASLWRRLLFRTTFIAITGSVGKTTTKQLLAGVLASRARTYKSIGNQNGGILVPLNVLRVRPWHRFAVLEIGIDQPGSMRPLARVVRPDIAVILAVARTHTQAFGNLDRCAAEKATLLESLAPGGLAVLNSDDARVAAMADRSRFRVCLIGTSPDCDLWAGQVSSRWPDRLSFRVHCGDEACEIRTQQLGSHWVPALVAALAVAARAGVPLRDAARVLERQPPYTARLEPVSLPNGAVVIRDDYSSSIDTMEASLEFLRQAQAQRRILVLSDIADSALNRRQRLKRLAASVSSWLDVLVLTGRDHAYGRRKAIESGVPPESVHSFPTMKETADFLKTELRDGDLVLLKGRTTDHIGRLFFAQLGSLACWQDYCPKTMLCDGCWELGFQPDAGCRPISIGRPV